MSTSNRSRIRFVLLAALALPPLVGCGDEKTVIPTTELTAEQKLALQAEDAKVADEESHGTYKNKKKRK
jgi:hypothetical protein